MSQFNEEPLEHGILNFYWPVTGITLYNMKKITCIDQLTLFFKYRNNTQSKQDKDRFCIEIFVILRYACKILWFLARTWQAWGKEYRLRPVVGTENTIIYMSAHNHLMISFIQTSGGCLEPTTKFYVFSHVTSVESDVSQFHLSFDFLHTPKPVQWVLLNGAA
mgnify:CR=1 FL=1